MGARKKNSDDTSEKYPLDEVWKRAVVLDVDEKHPTSFNQHTIGVGDNVDTEKALNLTKDSQLRHVVNSSKFDFERELNVAAMMIEAGYKLFKSPASSVFAPNKDHGDENCQFKFIECEFSKSSDKYKALILLEVELEKISSNESLIANVRTIADELFTNAVYNAPHKANSGMSTSRESKKVVEMKDGKKGQLFLAKDDQTLLVGCVDPFGTLDPDKIIERVHKCYEQGVSNVMNMDGEGGAGIGTFMAFDLSTNFYVGVKPGEMTVVMCGIPLNMSNRKIQKLPKNIHILKMEEN